MAWGSLNLNGKGTSISVKAYSSIISLPATAQENEIAIITSTAITDFQIRSDRQTTRSDGSALSGGEIWIRSNTNSIRPFNALSENSLIVYPLATAQQYVSGTWANVDVRIYQSGWKVLNVIFFDGGDVTSLTGGWTTGGSYGTYVYINCSNNSSATSSTNNQFDFTKITTLHITGVFNSSGSSSCQLRVSPNKSITGSVASVTLAAGSNATSGTLDVSAVNGSYYIVLYVTASTGASYVANIRMEFLEGY